MSMEGFSIPADTAAKVEEIYITEGLSRPDLEFEHIFQSASRVEALSQASQDARELYDSVIEIIEDAYPKNVLAEPVVRAIRIAAKENGWKSYDDVQFKIIRNELEKDGLILKAEKTNKDFNSYTDMKIAA